MFQSFFLIATYTYGDWKWTTWKHVVRAYLGALFLLIILLGQVAAVVWFNSVWGIFLDTLAHATAHTDAELWYGIGLFGCVAMCDIVLGTLNGYSRRLYTLWWREAITENYIPLWEKVTDNISAASQRIQEDTRDFTDLIENLGIDFLKSIITLFAFVPVLVALNMHIPPESPLGWSGSFVMVAISCATIGLSVSWVIGRPLPDIESNVRETEAEFRKYLVESENATVRRMMNGGWKTRFTAVINAYRQQFARYALFDGWSIGYDKAVMLLPYLLCIPYMRSGVITFALTIQLVHAFGEVQSGFSFVLKNWTKVTKLRGIYRRLRVLERHLEKA